MPQRQYNDERELDDLHEEVRERRWREDKPNFIDRIPPKARLYSGLAAVVWIWYGNTHNYSPGKIALYLIIGAVLLYFMFQSGGLRRELTDRECRISATQQIKWLQQTPLNGVLTIDPQAQVKISITGKRVMMEGQPWKREYKTLILNIDGTEDTYSAEIDVWNGDLIGVIERPAGFEGTEQPHIKTIASGDLKRARDAEQFYKRGRI